MQRITILPLAIIILLATLNPCHANPKDDSHWWKKEYGELKAGDNELAGRVHTVFKRVLAAADKRDGSIPRLLILPEIGDPWAVCLKDDTVLLTQKAMELCYLNTDFETGDSRAAFVLGHELSHLAKDDLWHLAAFEALEKFGRDKAGIKQVRQTLMKNETLKSIQEKEMRADKYGLLYAAMAGYNPTVIADKHGKNFFKEWVGQITGQIAYSKLNPPDTNKEFSHPVPEERASFVLSNLKEAEADLVLFHLGVRLFQAGKYEYALKFLNEFRQKYPCREVYNNIGLIHYQLALEKLIECDPQRALKFKLAAMLDTETRLSGNFRGRCPEGSTKMADFKRHIESAIQHFKDAAEKDPLYFPARVNLSSAYIINGSAADAMAAVDAALKLEGNDPGALSNQAVAVFLMGQSLDTDMASKAIERLEHVTKVHPHFKAGFYNLGRLLQGQSKPEKAQKAWHLFLILEHDGLYAANVKKRPIMKQDKEQVQHPQKHIAWKEACPSHTPPPLIRPGDCDKRTLKQLRKMRTRELVFGDIAGEYYTSANLEVLVIHDEIVLVEYPMLPSMPVDAMKAQYGRHKRIFKAPSGVESLVFSGFIADVEDALLKRVACYVNNDF